MRIAVIGAFGNMGRRYCAILRHLGVDYVPVDVCQHGDVSKCDGIIIATPTDTHCNIINQYSLFKLPVLCEKPICKNLENLNWTITCAEHPIRMINQYEYFEHRLRRNPSLSQIIDMESKTHLTYYDFFKTGQDGVLWDCINLIGLSKNTVKINNESPIWTCVLNGQALDIKEMDYAYIWNISDWIQKLDGNEEYILDAHMKVEKLDGSDIDRDSE